jgi:hypothetical protein
MAKNIIIYLFQVQIYKKNESYSKVTIQFTTGAFPRAKREITFPSLRYRFTGKVVTFAPASK